MTVNAPTCNRLHTSKVVTVSYACKCVYFRLDFLLNICSFRLQFVSLFFWNKHTKKYYLVDNRIAHKIPIHIDTYRMKSSTINHLFLLFVCNYRFIFNSRSIISKEQHTNLKNETRKHKYVLIVSCLRHL